MFRDSLQAIKLGSLLWGLALSCPRLGGPHAGVDFHTHGLSEVQCKEAQPGGAGLLLPQYLQELEGGLPGGELQHRAGHAPAQLAASRSLLL